MPSHAERTLALVDALTQAAATIAEQVGEVQRDPSLSSDGRAARLDEIRRDGETQVDKLLAEARQALEDVEGTAVRFDPTVDARERRRRFPHSRTLPTDSLWSDEARLQRLIGDVRRQLDLGVPPRELASALHLAGDSEGLVALSREVDGHYRAQAWANRQPGENSRDTQTRSAEYERAAGEVKTAIRRHLADLVTDDPEQRRALTEAAAVPQLTQAVERAYTVASRGINGRSSPNDRIAFGHDLADAKAALGQVEGETADASA